MNSAARNIDNEKVNHLFKELKQKMSEIKGLEHVDPISFYENVIHILSNNLNQKR